MRLILAIILLSIPSMGWATSQPAALIYYEKPGAIALIVDKSECSVNVFEFQGQWESVSKVSCTVGRIQGEKFREGDLKTPTGVYWLINSWTSDFLINQYGNFAKIYGVGAFELNYPNPLDHVVYQKSGSGIWLHGTDKGDPEGTRGCVSTSNEDLLKLAKYIELEETPFIIEDQLRYLSHEEIHKKQTDLLAFLESWRVSWEGNDTNAYLDFYDEDFRNDRFNYQQWRKHKTHVNRLNQNRSIQLEEIAIFEAKGFYHVRFVQHYHSSSTRDVGIKELFLSEKDGRYHIISERWKSLREAPLVSAFKYAYGEEKKDTSSSL